MINVNNLHKYFGENEVLKGIDETINKGDTTTILMTLITGGKSLMEAGSKTTVEIEYPSDIEFVSLEETQLYLVQVVDLQ